MKTFFFIISLICAAGLSAKELKVLMIGNSFSRSVLTYLPQIVEAGKRHKLLLANMYISGCSLERHCANIDAEKSRPDKKPYFYDCPGHKSVRKNLTEAVTAEKWDIITIQQGSYHSPYKSKTQKYGKKLINFVKQLAPQAEIVVHQTWAYRADHQWFTRKNATIDRQKMHDMLTENYAELAKSNKLRLIPMGNAVQLFREKLPVKTVKYTPADLKKLKEPATMDITGGDVVGYMKWVKKNKGSGNRLKVDRHHLGDPGEFMQGCVWYMFLFDAKASDIKLDYKGPNAELIKECAESAVAESRRVFKK